MSIALWCVLVAAVMPYVLTGMAKSGTNFDNNNPRAFLQTLTGRRARAHSAHQNAFEAFPFFAAAVIIAEMKGAGGTLLNALAVAFIIARVAYAAAYLGDRASLRSMLWAIGFVLALAIFTMPIWHG